MYKATYYKADGKKGRARALPDWLFDGVVNESALHQVVKAYHANQRQGTASAKNRSAVRGGASKPWRQKGTGRARQGTIRAAQWEGGGVAFPPIPHSWNQKVPKKVKGLARRSAFNARAEDDRVLLVDPLKMDGPKTAVVRDFLSAIEASGKILYLTDGRREDIYLSARNLPDVQVRPFGEESVYDVLWATTLVIERGALENADAGVGGQQQKEASDA
jgi:large subunit ribosomal protein L4